MSAMTKTSLVSLPDVLQENGYVSNFINSEPNHDAFSAYLNTFGFDKVITGKKSDLVKIGSEKALSDQKNYELLLEKSKKLSTTDIPFLLATYTFGTHTKLEGAEKFGDGKIPVFNRFYSMDKAFGQFWEEFKTSDLYENTVVIFTTDHTAYTDPEYMKNFKTGYNPFLDKVPLMIYYPGNTLPSLDVKGKNSLSLVPTILDILDLEDNENYFLGNSLFADVTSPYQYISGFGSNFYTTKNSRINYLKNQEVIDKIMAFDKISLNN
jgi:phosphoglycerol transferase MdoB-like AlkP superfamily enzyme